jgi:excisionase family DNA binding protein
VNDVKPALMTVEEMGYYLRISRAKAYAMAQAGQVPTVRFGRSVRIPIKLLDEWLAAGGDPEATMENAKKALGE